MDEPTGPLTWAALLGHWTEFARASLALPKDAEGERWRAAVAPIIALQAVTFALGDLEKLGPGDERALALDRADLLIRRHGAELRDLWRGEPLHAGLTAIIDDAHTALAAAREGGVEWTVTAERLVAEHPGDVVAALLASGFAGDLFVPVPGVSLFRNAPAAFARGPHGGPPDKHVIRAVKEFLIDVSRPARVPGPRQVYRQFDFGAGGPVRDVVVAARGTPSPGQPLLVAAIERGREVPVTLPIRGMSDVPVLPVVFDRRGGPEEVEEGGGGEAAGEGGVAGEGGLP